MSPSVAGIVLAAGTSSRMGTNKMLLPFGDESVLRGAVRRALDGGLTPVLVVLGADAERAAAELDGLPCRTVMNPLYEKGITSSLHAGLAALPETIDAAMVLLADMPFVTPDMIAGMIRRYQSTRAPLVISDYEGVNAPPMLYDRRLFAELAATPGERCGRQVVERHRGEAEVLQWSAAALADLDVPDDYDRLAGINLSSVIGRSRTRTPLA